MNLVADNILAEELDKTKTQEFEILMKNKGSNKIVVFDIEPSCGCTTLDSTNFIIEANSEYRLKLKINVEGAEGWHIKSVTVKYMELTEPYNLNVSITFKQI